MFSKSKVFIACLAITSLTAFGIGCGDDDNGSGNGNGGAFTSVEGSAEVGSLSEEDSKQLCEDQQAYLDSTAPANAEEKGCNLMGFTMAQFAYASNEDVDAAKITCKNVRDECLNPEEEETPTETADPCANPTYAETCTVTVDEFAACQKAHAQATLETLNSIPSCDDLSEEDFAQDEDAEDTPLEECVKFNAECAAS